MKNCPHCGTTLSEPTLFSAQESTSTTTQTCPVCGKLITYVQPPAFSHERSTALKTEATNPMDYVRSYLSLLWQIIRHPTSFFERMPLHGGMSGPVAFALATHWIGAAIAFLWQMPLSENNLKHFFSVMKDMDSDIPGFEPLLRRELLSKSDMLEAWTQSVGSILVDPFKTLIWIFLLSGIIFVGTRLIITPGRNGAPKSIEFETTVRIIGYSFAPTILIAIPFLGGLIAGLYPIYLTALGTKLTYKTDGFKAGIIALFPTLLILGGLLLMFSLLFGSIALLFGGLLSLAV